MIDDNAARRADSRGEARGTSPRSVRAAPPAAPLNLPPIGPGGPLVPDVRRIAVLRGGGLGDLVFALPALDALRAAYPAAEIVLLGAPWAVAFLASRPNPRPVDRVVPLPVAAGVHQPAGAPEDAADLRAFYEAMRAEQFDLGIQIHGGGAHSNPFLRRIRPRFTAGLQAPGAPPLDRNVPYAYYQSEVLRDLEVTSLVGAPPVRLEPRLAVGPDDFAPAATAVPEDAPPFVVLHPGAGDPRRRWPAESFAAVGDALAAAGARVVVTGLAGEADLTRSVCEAMAHPALDLAGRLALPGLVGLLSRASVVVSNDSGPLHLAAAVGAATVGIYWCGNLINAGPFSRSRHRPLLSWRLTCPQCGANCTEAACGHAVSFVADVSLDDVRDAALALLLSSAATLAPTEAGAA